MSDLPFSISKHKNGVYYVQFKNLETNKLMTAKSTRETSRKAAEKKAWQMYRASLAAAPDNPESLETKSFRQNLRKAELSDAEWEMILEECKRRGKIKNYVLKGSRADVPAYEFMLDFWDWEKSEYIAEKKRKAHSITKKHCARQRGYIKNHWKQFLGARLLGELTKQDILQFVNVDVTNKGVSFSAKNEIIRAGTSALKWAYAHELLERDITGGIVFFSGKHSERKILTPELAQAVFSVEWNNSRAKLANMLAMCTGLRSGEIRGLRLCDLGEGCIYVNHSWNDMEGLKCPKNGEERVVRVPFPQLIGKLKELGEHNHFGQGLEAFIFESTIPQKPMESSIFLDELRFALVKAGMSAEGAKEYTFHAWRHFFLAYMKDRVNRKVLQRQTGHKTAAMFEHYANHEIDGDIARLESAQIAVFGGYVEGLPAIEFDYEKIGHYVHSEYK